MLRVIVTGEQIPDEIIKKWPEAGCDVISIPIEKVTYEIQKEESNLFCDCVVHLGSTNPSSSTPQITSETSGSLSGAVHFTNEIRGLPNTACMQDGRKWRSIPIIHFIRNNNPLSLHDGALGDDTWLGKYKSIEENLDRVKQVVENYRGLFLDELDNLGLLVTYENGIYQVGHTLTEKNGIEGKYYYLDADSRRHTPGKLFTIGRDSTGQTVVVEEFERLINDKKTSEPDLQAFFENQPDFLPRLGPAQPLPHVKLPIKNGKYYVPDFILKPIVAAKRDDNWEVLDLKKPQAKIIVNMKFHPSFSAEVNKALTQLRDYRDYFQQDENRASIIEQLKHELKYPRLGVLIGRLPTGTELEELSKEQVRNPDVRIVTYDEVLEKQSRLIT